MEGSDSLNIFHFLDNENIPPLRYSREFANRLFKVKEKRAKVTELKEADILETRASSSFVNTATFDTSKLTQSRKSFGLVPSLPSRSRSCERSSRGSDDDSSRSASVGATSRFQISKTERDESAMIQLNTSISELARKANRISFKPKPWLVSNMNASEGVSKHKLVNQGAIPFSIFDKASRKGPWPGSSGPLKMIHITDIADATNETGNEVNIEYGHETRYDHEIDDSQDLQRAQRWGTTTGNLSTNSMSKSFSNIFMRSATTRASGRGTSKPAKKSDVRSRGHIILTGLVIDRSTEPVRSRPGILVIRRGSSSQDIIRAILQQFNLDSISELSLTLNYEYSGEVFIQSMVAGTLVEHPNLNDACTFKAYTGGEPDLVPPATAPSAISSSLSALGFGGSGEGRAGRPRSASASGSGLASSTTSSSRSQTISRPSTSPSHRKRTTSTDEAMRGADNSQRGEGAWGSGLLSSTQEQLKKSMSMLFRSKVPLGREIDQPVPSYPNGLSEHPERGQSYARAGSQSMQPELGSYRDSIDAFGMTGGDASNTTTNSSTATNTTRDATSSTTRSQTLFYHDMLASKISDYYQHQLPPSSNFLPAQEHEQRSTTSSTRFESVTSTTHSTGGRPSTAGASLASAKEVKFDAPPSSWLEDLHVAPTVPKRTNDFEVVATGENIGGSLLNPQTVGDFDTARSGTSNIVALYQQRKFLQKNRRAQLERHIQRLQREPSPGPSVTRGPWLSVTARPRPSSASSSSVSSRDDSASERGRREGQRQGRGQGSLMSAPLSRPRSAQGLRESSQTQREHQQQQQQQHHQGIRPPHDVHVLELDLDLNGGAASLRRRPNVATSAVTVTSSSASSLARAAGVDSLEPSLTNGISSSEQARSYYHGKSATQVTTTPTPTMGGMAKLGLGPGTGTFGLSPPWASPPNHERRDRDRDRGRGAEQGQGQKQGKGQGQGSGLAFRDPEDTDELLSPGDSV